MHTNDFESSPPRRDTALGAVEAALRDIAALIGELDVAATKQARRIVAGAHIRATLARRARESGAAGARASR